jgi:hypothetical protein
MRYIKVQQAMDNEKKRHQSSHRSKVFLSLVVAVSLWLD